VEDGETDGPVKWHGAPLTNTFLPSPLAQLPNRRSQRCVEALHCSHGLLGRGGPGGFVGPAAAGVEALSCVDQESCRQRGAVSPITLTSSGSSSIEPNHASGR
jgi:hypothetical protein